MTVKPENSIVTHSYDIGASTPLPAADVDRARDLIGKAKSANTRRVYASSWSVFESWCADKDLDPLAAQPEQVAVYLAWRLSEGLLPSSLTREYSALAFYLRSSTRAQAEVWRRRYRPHVISELLSGAWREHGRPAEKKRAVGGEMLLSAALAPLEAWGRGIQAVRDRALFLVGFHGAFRRSELVGLDRSDLHGEDAGAVIVLRRSKTDQEGKGHMKAIPRFPEDESICPVKALSTWVKCARVKDGPLFRALNGDMVTPDRIDDRTVANAVKRIAQHLRYDPEIFAGHSLRSGFITFAHQNGMSVAEIQLQTGHRNGDQVIDYIQRANPFKGNAALGVREALLKARAKRSV